MTYRELRQLLCTIDNQDLTIGEFRALLFEEKDQDKEISEYKKTFYINNNRI